MLTATLVVVGLVVVAAGLLAYDDITGPQHPKRATNPNDPGGCRIDRAA